jgi:hypothetical protein
MVNFECWTVNSESLSSSSSPRTDFCLLPSVFWGRRDAKGLLAGMAALDKMSPPTGKERTRNFRKRTNNTGMYMKTKERPLPAHRKARMLQKTK